MDDDPLDRLAALAEPVRRALYRFVVAQAAPVGRDTAADGVGVARHTAKFHLDRLVADGLLEVEYRRPPGRAGPGAGRPAKLYRRAPGDIAITLPERRYGLAARVLADAVDAARGGTPLDEALHAAAATAGHDLAARSGGLDAALAAAGYEPRAEDGRVILANCPFHALAATHTDLVCGLNLDLVATLVDDLTAGRTHLDPAPGRCCVTITRTPR